MNTLIYFTSFPFHLLSKLLVCSGRPIKQKFSIFTNYFKLKGSNMPKLGMVITSKFQQLLQNIKW